MKNFGANELFYRMRTPTSMSVFARIVKLPNILRQGAEMPETAKLTLPQPLTRFSVPLIPNARARGELPCYSDYDIRKPAAATLPRSRNRRCWAAFQSSIWAIRSRCRNYRSRSHPQTPHIDRKKSQRSKDYEPQERITLVLQKPIP